MGAGGDPAPAEAEVVGRVAKVEFIFAAVDPAVGIIIELGGLVGVRGAREIRAGGGGGGGGGGRVP